MNQSIIEEKFNHRCPWCKRDLVFYRVKESERYYWESCAGCGFKRRTKKIPKIQPKQINLFAHNY